MTSLAADPADLLPWQVLPDTAKLHVADCPHLSAERLAQLRPATEAEVADLLPCLSCQSIRDGARRQYFSSFDDALEALPAPVENRARMRQIAARLEIGRIWIPSSRQYIAVAPVAGADAAAYFNRSFVDVRRTEGGYEREELPSGAQTQSGARAKNLAERTVTSCPACHMQLPSNGICDNCDA